MSVAVEIEPVEGEVVEAALSADEARRLTDEARDLAQDLWRRILRLYEGGAHTALGYPSWAAYFNAEFRGAKPGQRIDAKHPYRLLRAARVEAELSVLVDTRGLTEAQARVLAPLAPEVRAEIARRVDERGGFGAIRVRDIEEIRDEVLGRRRVADGRLIWDEAALRGAAAALRRLGSLSRAFGSPGDLRELSADDAGRVRAVVAVALREVDEARRTAQAVIATLEAAARALDGRGDLPDPPWPSSSWAAFDHAAGVGDVRQMTLQDVLDAIGDEAAADG